MSNKSGIWGTAKRYQVAEGCRIPGIVNMKRCYMRWDEMHNMALNLNPPMYFPATSPHVLFITCICLGRGTSGSLCTAKSQNTFILHTGKNDGKYVDWWRLYIGRFNQPHLLPAFSDALTLTCFSFFFFSISHSTRSYRFVCLFLFITLTLWVAISGPGNQ